MSHAGRQVMPHSIHALALDKHASRKPISCLMGPSPRPNRQGPTQSLGPGRQLEKPVVGQRQPLGSFHSGYRRRGQTVTGGDGSTARRQSCWDDLEPHGDGLQRQHIRIRRVPGGQVKCRAFIFATEDGTISGWNPTVNTTNADSDLLHNSGSGAILQGPGHGE